MTVTEEHTSADTLKEVGAELSTARAERGLSVSDIASHLRLIPAYIEAIERGDMSSLPSAPYVVGYVRSYANHLGLDPDALCGRLREGLGRDQFHPEYNFVGDRMPHRSGTGRMAFAAVVVLMVGYGGWYAYDAGLVAPEDRYTSGEVVETVLPGLTDTAETAQPGDVAPVEGDGAAEPVGTAESPLGERSAPGTGLGGEPADDASAAADAGGWDDPSAGPASSQVGQAVAHNRNPDTEMVLKALATSWVEISRPDGSIVSSWLMHEGDEYPVPGDEDIYLTAGNAGGLEIEIAGRPPRKLGEWGETVNELPLDPALLSDRY